MWRIFDSKMDEGFVQRVTRHRGPKQGDPHREAPRLKVVRIEQIFSKRLQDKYLAAVQDEIGLCGSQLACWETPSMRSRFAPSKAPT